MSAVKVCPDCDIAGCKHIRAMPEVGTELDRIRFEKWYLEKYGHDIAPYRTKTGYLQSRENDRYEGWLASLSARPAITQEPFGYFRAQPFGWEDCSEHDEGAKALYEVPPDAAALVASLQALSVTNIMIGVVPGDGSGREVYAKSVRDVELLLNAMALELDKYENNSPIAKLRITDKGEHSLHLLALANSVKDPEAAFKALIARLGVGEFELCLKGN